MKTVGLALGGGSAKGCAHIGVIKALEEHNIPIQILAGTSIGSLIGGVYASGNLHKLNELASDINWQLIVKHLDLAFPRQGLMSGKRVEKFLKELLEVKTIEELKIPYCAVAADIASASEVQFRSGNVVDAIRASISLPAIFTPIPHENQLLADGGLVNPLPINVVRDMGADIVIAVDLNHGKNRLLEDPKSPATLDENASFFDQLKNHYEEASQSVKEKIREWTKANEPAMFDVLGWSINIMQSQITEKNLKEFPADVLLRPQLGHIRGIDFHKAEEMIDIGYEVTMSQMEEIKELCS
jgi:NTE family protein